MKAELMTLAEVHDLYTAMWLEACGNYEVHDEALLEQINYCDRMLEKIETIIQNTNGDT